MEKGSLNCSCQKLERGKTTRSLKIQNRHVLEVLTTQKVLNLAVAY